jgi:uncharacterized protein (DUF58 family)
MTTVSAAFDRLRAPGVSVDTETLLRVRSIVKQTAAERRLAASGRAGGFATRRRGRGLEAVDVRVFSEGDDIRHLDRNTTARTGVPHIRTFQDEREKTVLLIADFRPSMLWGTRRAFRSVAAAQSLAAVGWEVIEAGGRVSAIAVLSGGPPVFVPARGRERGMVTVIGGLASAHKAALSAAAAMPSAGATVEPSLAEVFEAAAKLLVNSGGSVFLASALDHPGEAFERAAGALSRRAHLTVLLIQDAFQLRPPPGSYRYATSPGRSASTFISSFEGPRPPDAPIGLIRQIGADVLPIDASADLYALVRQVTSSSHGRR